MVGCMDADGAVEDGTLLPGEGHLLIIDRMPDLAAALRLAAPPRSPGES